MKTQTINAPGAKAKSTKATQSKNDYPKSEKTDVYQLITDAIIARLEAGVIPWKCSWSKSSTLPANYLTKRAYNGINAFLLASFGYEHPFFLTFNQAKQLGGMVRKGAKSIPVIFYKLLDKTTPANASGNAKADEKIPLLQYYRVFHISDIEGIEFKLPERALPGIIQSDIDLVKDCEEIIATMPNAPAIVFEGSQPCYIPSLDIIRMVSIERFISKGEYYQTLFHELVHATGHKSRLNRDLTGGFGSNSYSIEELIAEMGASYLSALTGIETNTLLDNALLDNAAGYIQGWLKALKNDRKMLITAASKAQKATEYIAGPYMEKELQTVEGQIVDQVEVPSLETGA